MRCCTQTASPVTSSHRALRSAWNRPPTRHPFLHPHRALFPAVLPLSPTPTASILCRPPPPLCPGHHAALRRDPLPPVLQPQPYGGVQADWRVGEMRVGDLSPMPPPPVTCCTSTAPARSEKVAQCRAAALYRHGGSSPSPAPPGRRRMAARGPGRGYVRARCGRGGPPPSTPPPSQQRAAVGPRVGLGRGG